MSSAVVDRSPDPVLDAIATRRRRLVLAVLEAQPAPVSERELAVRVAAIEAEKRPVDVTPEEAAPVRVDLVHAQLPKLEAASLVAHDSDGVTTTDHPALESRFVGSLVEAELNDDGSAPDARDREELTAVVAALASRRRRAVLAALEDHDGPMAVDDLAVAVRRRETGDELSDVPDEVLVSLHHVHLPKLAAADLVAYDADAGTVTYEGRPALGRIWSGSSLDEMPCVV